MPDFEILKSNETHYQFAGDASETMSLNWSDSVDCLTSTYNLVQILLRAKGSSFLKHSFNNNSIYA